jgi:uncharacterized protein (DUF4415 family)
MKSMVKNKSIKYGKKKILQPGDLDPRNVKERITIFLDEDIVDEFRKRAKEVPGGKYQALINDALRVYLEKAEGLEARLQKIEQALFKKQA